jgi:hypothetical protein
MKTCTIIGLLYVPLGIPTKDDELDLPSLYWIPKLHKCPFKQVILLGLPNAPRKLFLNY